MNSHANSAMADDDARDFDIVVLGATGLTGRLVVEHLARGRRNPDDTLRWAVAGRNRSRLDAVINEVGAPNVVSIVADLTAPSSLNALAARTKVLLNLAGPYTGGAEAVIEACIDAGTSYVDLSGEIPLLQRVNDRFDRAAAAAGVAVVQMAGWEALPADLTTMLACREAVRRDGDTAPVDGPGASEPVETVNIRMSFDRVPGGVGQSVSGGTLGSIVAMLADRGASAVGDPAALLPPSGSAATVRSVSPLRLLPYTRAGRGFGPIIPVAFLDPPVIHRTAAVLASDRGDAHEPARFEERNDLGPTNPWALLEATALAGIQRSFIGIAQLPSPARRLIAGALRRVVPAAGTGPSGRFLTDWAWTVRATATTRDGSVGEASMTGTGHPGYTATAAMIATLGIHLADTDRQTRRSGCLTPALAFGTTAALDQLSTDGLCLKVS